MTLTVVLLTKTDERPIGRALASVAGIADRVFVIDSGSTDRTVEIAREAPVAGVSVSRRMTFLGRVPGSSEIPPGAGVPTLQHLK